MADEFEGAGVTVFLVSSGSKNQSEFVLLEHAAQLVIAVASSAKKPIIKLERPPSSTREPFLHSIYELKFPSSELTAPTFAPVAPTAQNPNFQPKTSKACSC